MVELEFLDANHPRKLMRRLRRFFNRSRPDKTEMNILRGWITQFKADVAAANNLADLKTSVAAQPDLPDRTLAQLKTAIRTRIDKDD